MTTGQHGPDSPTPDEATEATPPAEPREADAPSTSTSAEAPAAAPEAAAPAEPAAPEAEAAAPAAPEAEAAAPEAEAAAPAAPEPDSEAAAPEAETDAPRMEGGAEAGPAGDKKKKRRKKRKKKPGGGGERHPSHRPATERAPFHVGEEVFGKVTAVLDTAIMVDLGGKALAIFDRSEMEPDDLVPSVADRFVASVLNDGARGGLVVLTRKPLREEEAKPFVEMAAKDGTHIPGLVTGVIKGGVEVDIRGLRAFAPASGMDLHPNQANFAALLGQELDFKVVHYKSAGRDIVVTRRPMLEAEAHERRKHALGLLEEGKVMKGVVRTVVEWGAFVALPEAENLEGLVHVSEASHDARARMAELFKPGDQVEVKITKIDDKGKIWLSRKALLEDPWAEAKQKYAPGSRHTGKAVRVEEFGVFVQLDSGVDGLIHVSDLSLTRVEHPNQLVTEGQDVDVIVHHFDTRSKRIALHPAPPPERAEEAPQKVARNQIVKVEVLKPESSGLVVRVLGVTGRSARGFVPAGQTGTQRGTDLRKAFKIGSQFDAKILDVDPRRGEPKLSIRAMKDDEERRAHREYRQALQREGGFGTLGDLLKKKFPSAGED
jgi:small subunit ribosomal protein S1